MGEKHLQEGILYYHVARWTIHIIRNDEQGYCIVCNDEQGYCTASSTYCKNRKVVRHTGLLNLVITVVTFSACTLKVILSNLNPLYLLFLREACRSLNSTLMTISMHLCTVFNSLCCWPQISNCGDLVVCGD